MINHTINEDTGKVGVGWDGFPGMVSYFMTKPDRMTYRFCTRRWLVSLSENGPGIVHKRHGAGYARFQTLTSLCGSELSRYVYMVDRHGWLIRASLCHTCRRLNTAHMKSYRKHQKTPE